MTVFVGNDCKNKNKYLELGYLNEIISPGISH